MSGHLHTAVYLETRRAAVYSALAVGSVAQLPPIHCPNERTFDAAVCSYNRPT